MKENIQKSTLEIMKNRNMAVNTKYKIANVEIN